MQDTVVTAFGVSGTIHATNDALAAVTLYGSGDLETHYNSLAVPTRLHVTYHLEQSAPDITSWNQGPAGVATFGVLNGHQQSHPLFVQLYAWNNGTLPPQINGTEDLTLQPGDNVQIQASATFYYIGGGGNLAGHVDVRVSFTAEWMGPTVPDEKRNDTNEPPPAKPDSPDHRCDGDDFTDPVLYFNGELSLPAIDMRIPGRGMDFLWSRRYRSRNGPNTAMGNNWDYSYNISISPGTQGATNVSTGWGRSDRYRQQSENTWVRLGDFNELRRNADLSYTLVFPSSGQWNFLPLDDSPSAGKIASIVDRNGNTIVFGYNVFGRLVTITDTLGRGYALAYTTDGFIHSLTDFNGREVTYSYYTSSDAAGGPGDLRSATTPAVTDTPTGNDFPSGKTTTYTYSKGFADEELNHNLLSVTDGRGNTYVTNEYSSDPDTALEFRFDRVLRQVWGNPTDMIDLRYFSHAPDSGDPSVAKVIIRDRLGHVKELGYDDYNRRTEFREYTGLADPTMPTTQTTNRPTNQLRPDDPAFFRTQWQYNADSLITRIDHPNGNAETFAYDSLNPDPRAHGNLLQRQRSGIFTVTSLETFEYVPGLGACCGTSFVSRYVDPNGNQTLYTYDDHGNRTQTNYAEAGVVENWEYNEFDQMTAHILPDNGAGHRRRDEYSYFDDGPARGYLRQVIVDAGGFALTTTFERDGRGNVTREIDPRGNDTLYVVNERDQIIRRSSPQLTTPSGPVRFNRDTFYDANDNVVRIDVSNLDETGQYSWSQVLSTRFEYETLNHLVRVSRDVFPDQEVAVEYQYDANRNLRHIRFGAAVTDQDPDNTLTIERDERDFPFRVVRAPASFWQSSTQIDYDGNRNVTAVHEGLEDSPRVTRYSYDGLDRLSFTIDPMGNHQKRLYDNNSNIIIFGSSGELQDISDEPGNLLLRAFQYRYDALNRRTRVEETFSNTPIDSLVPVATSQFAYNGNSKIIGIVDDNGNATTFAYDSANRMALVTDAIGNTKAYSYDANSNLVTITETEKSDLGNADQVFVTQMAYDPLNRRISRTDSAGNVTQYDYDSRNNPVLEIDANGHETCRSFDGMNRQTSTCRQVDGDPDHDIITSQSWDPSSRLIIQSDGNANDTYYFYDALNRLDEINYADNTHELRYYDVHGNVVSRVEPNGTMSRFSYDFLNRMTDVMGNSGAGVWKDTTFGPDERDVRDGTSPGPKGNSVLGEGGCDGGSPDCNGNGVLDECDIVDGTSRDCNANNVPDECEILDGSSPDCNVNGILDECEIRDGTSRDCNENDVPDECDIRDGMSPDCNGNDVTYTYDGLSRLVRAQTDQSVVTFSYDTLSNVTTESQNGEILESSYDGLGNKTRCTYPGGRVISSTFDALDRRKTISDEAGLIAAYDYIGPRRVERKTLGNGTRVDLNYDGINGVPNPPGDLGSRQIVAITHSRVSDGALLDARTLAWDAVGNKARRTDARSGGPQLTHAYSYDAADRLIHTIVSEVDSNPVRDNSYALDRVGNRLSVSGPDGGTYSLALNHPDNPDYPSNRYASTPFDRRSYDENANLVARSVGDATGDGQLRLDDMQVFFDCIAGPFTPPSDPSQTGFCPRFDLNGDGDVDMRDFNQFQVSYSDGPVPTESYGYDFRNRLVRYTDLSGITTNYTYDALSRRIAKTTNVGGVLQTERFFYDGFTVAEEQDGMGDTQATYVTGNYIDETLTMRRGSNDFYYHSDDLFNVLALTDSSGAAVERYDYLDYGRIQISDSNGSPREASAVRNPYGFTGRRFDPESGMWDLRNRYLDSRAGRFVTPDPMGVWHDQLSFGNAYVYTGNRPMTFVDPFGLYGLSSDDFRPGGPLDPNTVPSPSSPGSRPPLIDPSLLPPYPIPGTSNTTITPGLGNKPFPQGVEPGRNGLPLPDGGKGLNISIDFGNGMNLDVGVGFPVEFDQNPPFVHPDLSDPRVGGCFKMLF